MSEEEKKVVEETTKVEEKVIKKDVESDLITERDAKIAKLEEERDNYKAVALKRLGKLSGDAEFLAGDDSEKKELSIAEQIRLALLDKEVEVEKKAKEEDIKRLIRENSELKLVIKNNPQTSIGGGSTESKEVSDNVFSQEQLYDLRKRAERLKADPEKFIEKAKKNFLSHR